MEEYEVRPTMSLREYLENYSRRVYNVDVHFLVSCEMADYIIEKSRTSGRNRSEVLRDMVRDAIERDADVLQKRRV